MRAVSVEVMVIVRALTFVIVHVGMLVLFANSTFALESFRMSPLCALRVARALARTSVCAVMDITARIVPLSNALVNIPTLRTFVRLTAAVSRLKRASVIPPQAGTANSAILPYVLDNLPIQVLCVRHEEHATAQIPARAIRDFMDRIAR
mmetsp:Transcript_6826/g.25486  ORF Transcript_6826/g.25486 Transcript_6826/m.25486 type:complete len:150 (-) Transcript_6826:4581-5030(-)